MTNWRYYFLNIILEPFLKNVYFDHWWQNKPFRLPTRNKTNHSPVFQNYSHTVVQYTSFNVKPTKMLSDPVAEAFGLIHRHLRVKISALCTVQVTIVSLKLVHFHGDFGILSFRHFHLSALWSLLGALRHLIRMTHWRYYFLNIISEPFLKNEYFDHWWQNKPFRLPTRNKTNNSPVFQNYSHTVVQYTSFNVKPTKMLSVIRWQRPSAWSTVTYGWKISAVYLDRWAVR